MKGQKGQNTHMKVENWLQARGFIGFNCRGGIVYQKDSFLKEKERGAIRTGNTR